MRFDAIGLAFVTIDPERDVVRLVNRSPYEKELDSVTLRSRRGWADLPPTIAGFGVVEATLPLSGAADHLILEIDGEASLYLEYGAPSEETAIREALWIGGPIDAPASGELIVLRDARFDGPSPIASAYTSAPAGGSIAGRVADLDGAAVSGEVAISCDADERFGAPTTLDSDGAFEVDRDALGHHCWLRIEAEGFVPRMVAFLPDAASLGTLHLQRWSDEAGTRVAPNRVEFAGGATLEASPADLDAAGPLYLTRIDLAAATRLSLDPTQPYGAVAVTGVDRDAHIVFEGGAAVLEMPVPDELRGLAGLEPGERSIRPLTELDLGAAPRAAAISDGSAMLVGEESVTFIVERFSQRLFTQDLGGGWDSGIMATLIVTREYVDGTDRRCLCARPGGDRTACKIKFEITTTEAEGSTSSSEFQRQIEAGFESQGASLGASVAEKIANGESQSGSSTLSQTCAITLNPHVCEHQEVGYEEARDTYRVKFYELETEYRFVTVNLAIQTVVIPIPSQYWREMDRSPTRSVISGCRLKPTVSVPDLRGCGCSEPAGAGTSGTTGTHVTYGDRSVLQSAPPASCPGVGSVSATLTRRDQSGECNRLVVEEDGVEALGLLAAACDRHCRSVGGDSCKGTLEDHPPAYLSMQCTEASGRHTRTVEAVQDCRCAPKSDGTDTRTSCVPSDCDGDPDHACLIGAGQDTFTCQLCEGSDCSGTGYAFEANATIDHGTDEACATATTMAVDAEIVGGLVAELLGYGDEICGLDNTVALAAPADGTRPLARTCSGSVETITVRGVPVCG